MMIPATTNGLPAIHPGVFLQEILQEMHMPQSAFATSLGVSSMRISHVIRGKRPITADLALRVAQALGQSPQYWMNLQASYDLKTAQASLADTLQTIPLLQPVA
jgi:antitoxin HigA-1